MTRLLASLLITASVAHAGIGPVGGGTLQVVAATAPGDVDPSEAWTPSEVLVATATSTGLEDLCETLRFEQDGHRATCPLRPELFEGKEPVDAAAIVRAVSAAGARVSLPPMTWSAPAKGTLVLESPFDLREALALPWVRVPARLVPPAFRRRAAAPGAFEGNALATAGRPFLQQIRVDAKLGKRLDPPADGVVLSRAGAPGRPVFVHVKRAHAVGPGLQDALAQLDRDALVRLFVRGVASVPAQWPTFARAASAGGAATICIDEAEKDTRSAAERMQVFLRDRKFVVKLAAMPRAAFFERVRRDECDAALVAIPAAPVLVQAATLALVIGGPAAADGVWREAARSTKPLDAFQAIARRVDAMLLYEEGGAIAVGTHVRGVKTEPSWAFDAAGAWLVPSGFSP